VVELAKKVERSYRFETNDSRSSFISYGNRDSMKKGLLAGEKLQADLRRMELSYMDKNKRQLELTKNVSLAMLNPTALMQLKENTSCHFEIPELLYDLDFPGHYMRRIKSVSITIPAVTGPNVNINCTLNLTNSKYRKNTELVNGYPIVDANDTRFVENNTGESIAASSAQNDSGLFQFNFDDERYLPFEGAGAISKWSLELPDTLQQFDYDTISDVILHINYYALAEGGAFKEDARTNVIAKIDFLLNEMAETSEGLRQIISMKANFGNELHQLSTDGQTSLNILQKHFPYFLNNKEIAVSGIEIYTKSAGTISIGGSGSLTLVEGENGYYKVIHDFSSAINIPDDMPINMTSSLTENVNDIILILKYTIS